MAVKALASGVDRADGGSLLSGRKIADQYGRHEWWVGWSNARVQPASSMTRAASPLWRLAGKTLLDTCE
jgi:hypothetical protein